MAKLSTIETELLEATGLKQKENEKRQRYLTRLIEEVQELSDKEWNDLSDETQEWVNAGADSIKGQTDISDFPGAEKEDNKVAKKAKAKPAAAETDDDDDVVDPSTGEVTENVKKAADKAAKKSEKATDKTAKKADKTAEKEEKAADKAEKKADKKADKPKGERKVSGASTDGIKARIKKIVFKKPNITTDALLEQLEKQGGDKMSRHTVGSVRNEVRHTLRVLKQVGMLPDIDI